MENTEKIVTAHALSALRGEIMKRFLKTTYEILTTEVTEDTEKIVTAHALRALRGEIMKRFLKLHMKY